MAFYVYTLTGLASNGQPWTTHGTIEALPGEFPAVCTKALSQSFAQLTRGEAVFGSPGVGCTGPYTIGSFLIELAEPVQ